MNRADIKLIREEIESLKGWINHWETDRFCKLIPSENSLMYGKHSAERALSLLDRLESEQKELA